MADEGNKEIPKVPKVRFVYRKARHHRTLHADGAWAAITPQLEVQFSLFNDLRIMPDEVTHLVTDKGGIGDEVSKEPPEKLPPDVLREVDVTVVVSKDTAKNLITALGQMVKQIDDHIEKVTKTSLDSPVGEQEVS